jgi:hypothetical protein
MQSREELDQIIIETEKHARAELMADLVWFKRYLPFIYYPLYPLIKYQANKIIKDLSPSQSLIK